jgi:hypothetical protein
MRDSPLLTSFPLVHNSPYFRDCGYYYEGNNVDAAAAALRRAITEHDARAQEYQEAAAACIQRFHTDNTENLATFQHLIEEVLDTPPREPF